MEYKCPNCNESMIYGEDMFSLLKSKFINDGVVQHSAKEFFPVNTYLCRKCGKVELFHATIGNFQID